MTIAASLRRHVIRGDATRGINVTNGLMTVTAANMGSLTNKDFQWTADKNKMVFNKANNPNAFKLSFVAKSGALKGSFLTNAPDKLSKKLFNGVVLQNADVARGNFKGDGETGTGYIKDRDAP